MDHLEGLPIEVLRQIEAISSDWERDRRAGRIPSLREFLEQVPAEYRTALFEELLDLDRQILLETASRGIRGEEGRNVGEWKPAGAAVVEGPHPADPALPGADAELVRMLRFRGYELQRELGRGGMGVVYLASQTALRRLVCIKMLRTSFSAASEGQSRFRQEAELMARLRHPGIVQVFEVGQAGDLPYLAMEYVEGGTLADLVRGNPQPPAESARLLLQLAEVVAFAHSRGVLHRDLKPSNLLIEAATESERRSGFGRPDAAQTGSGASFGLLLAKRLRIADFGLAKLLVDAPDLTASGIVVGTPSYMAPEQAESGLTEVGPAADIYSLGAILYELLTGRPPHRGQNAAETIQLVLTKEAVPVRRIVPSVPRDLETICHKCMSRQPQQRYASCDDLKEDLERFLAGRSILAKRPTAAGKLLKWARRSPVLAGLAVLCLGSVIGLLAVWAHFTLRLEAANVLANGRLAQARDAAQKLYLMARNDKQLQSAGLDRLRNRLEQEALELTERLRAGATDDLQLLRDLANAYHSVGQSTYRLDGHEAAVGYLRQALDLAEKVESVVPEDEVATGVLLAASSAMGIILGEQGQFEESIRVLRRGISAKEKMLPREDQDARGFSEFQLSRIGTHLARVLHRAGRFDEARNALATASRYIQGRIDLFARKRELIPEDYLDTRGRVAVLNGLVAKATGDVKRAEAFFDAALEDFERIARQGVERGVSLYPAYRHERAGALLERGRLEAERGGADGALVFLERARKDAQDAIGLSPEVWLYRRRLADVESELARIAWSRGDRKEAKTRWGTAMEERRRLVEQLPSSWLAMRELLETVLEGREAFDNGTSFPLGELRDGIARFRSGPHREEVDRLWSALGGENATRSPEPRGTP